MSAPIQLPRLTTRGLFFPTALAFAARWARLQGGAIEREPVSTIQASSYVTITYVVAVDPWGRNHRASVEGLIARDTAAEVARSLWVQDAPREYDHKARRRDLPRLRPDEFVARHWDAVFPRGRFDHEILPFDGAPPTIKVLVSVRNGLVSRPLTVGPSHDYREPWLVLAKFLTEVSTAALDAPPQYGSQSAQDAKESARKTRAGCLVTLGFFGVMVLIGSILSALNRPAREFSQAVQGACDRYVAAASVAPGLFSYLEAKGVCRLARRVAYKRWEDVPRDRLASEAVLDACLLLATDPSKSARKGDEYPRVPRYAVIPAHFARDHVEECQRAATAVAVDLRGR